ncbi:MAG TPA: Rieske 2Fe-2S domain-containing protein [Acidimicrobiales bacterium]|jgi:nitrite reductase/ring-hydroxylating ferredoxin subunit|nr:Rieske 2Fe-2S domain-containing protein [Acidimicrobiales bacterium]
MTVTDTHHYPEGWYAIERSARVRRRPVGVRRFGLDLTLWRDTDGTIACVPSPCPHRGADLSQGNVHDGALVCHYHGFAFGADGGCRHVPCDGPDARRPPRLRTTPRPVREEHGLVWTWWGAGEPADGPVPWFDDLHDDPGQAVVSLEYGCHLSRFMENTFDVHHFAHVHRWVLPTAGSHVTLTESGADGDRISIAGSLTALPGERGRRPMDFHIRARFPTTVHLRLAGTEFVVMAAPIDDRHTWVAARYYLRQLGSGRVARAASWLFAQADAQIAQRQDRRVLDAIRPVVGGPHENVLARADRGVSLWYRLATATERAVDVRARAG